MHLGLYQETKNSCFGDRGFVMGWGWSTRIANCTHLVTEYAADGTEVFHLEREGANPQSVNPTYRCVKCE